MNQTRLYKNHLQNTEYIDGNTVRKLAPEKRERPNSQERVRTKQKQQLEVNENGLPMSAPHVAFLVAVSFICLAICVVYLNVQSNIRATRDNISELRKNITTVQTQNNALNYAINSFVNVDHIYKEATTKLGMRQASDNQITTYKSSDSGYTLQYGEIPDK